MKTPQQPLDQSEWRMISWFSTLQTILYFALTAVSWGTPAFYWLLVLMALSLACNFPLRSFWTASAAAPHPRRVFLLTALNLLISFGMTSVSGGVDSPMFPMYYLPPISAMALLVSNGRGTYGHGYVAGIAGLASVLTLITHLLKPHLNTGDYFRIGVLCISYYSLGFSILMHNRRLRHIMHESMTDHLTGVFNKRAGEQYLTDLWPSHLQERSLCIGFCDLDRFKQINDQYGHLCGDLILRQTADLIRTHIPRGTAVVRWGGEEFLLIMRDIKQEEAVQMLEALRQAIERHTFHVLDQTLQLTISSGVVDASRFHSVHEALMEADRLLYVAKQNGRNRVIS